MKKSIVLTPDGAKVLRQNILSCGSQTCLEIVGELERVSRPVPLHQIGADQNGRWKMPAFERLQWYAVDNSVTCLDAFRVAHYFGGTTHINIFARIAEKTRFGRDFGKAVGLVTHVLLPLKEGKYQNGGRVIEFKDFVHADPQGTGPEFYHLGLVMRIPLTEEQVEEILLLQRENHLFWEAVKKINEPILFPKNYLEGLNCTVKAATN